VTLQLCGEGRRRDGAQRVERLLRDRGAAGRAGSERCGAGLDAESRLCADGLERLRLLDDLVADAADPVELDLDDVAGDERARAGGRPRQHDVARLEGDEAGEVGDEVREREDELGGASLLRERAVHVGAEREIVEVDVACGDDAGPHRREPVLALREDVRAAIDPAVVVDAEVVRGGDPPDASARVGHGDASCGGADHDCDLALVAEQVAPGRADDRDAVTRQRRGRLQEVGRHVGHAPPLLGAAAEVQVHADHLRRCELER
jgi:hypothetical protein